MEMFYKIVTNIFGSGAVILGLVTLFGNMFLKKKGSDVLLSTIRSMMGFALIDGGSAILCAAIAPLTQCIFEGLNTFCSRCFLRIPHVPQHIPGKLKSYFFLLWV